MLDNNDNDEDADNNDDSEQLPNLPSYSPTEIAVRYKPIESQQQIHTIMPYEMLPHGVFANFALSSILLICVTVLFYSLYVCFSHHLAYICCAVKIVRVRNCILNCGSLLDVWSQILGSTVYVISEDIWKGRNQKTEKWRNLIILSNPFTYILQRAHITS